MNIQLLVEEDLPACATLFADVFSDPPWNETWLVEAVTRRMDECWRTPDFVGLGAKNKGDLVGFALGFVEQWHTTRHFQLKEMCVAPELQRHGVGSDLMRSLEDHLRETGVSKIILHTARDSDAQAFYDQRGFYTSVKIVMMSKWLTPQG